MRRRIYALLPLLGLALAQNQTGSTSYITNFFSLLLGAQGVLQLVQNYIYAPIGGLATSMSVIAIALAILGLLYRIYNLWLSEAPPQSLYWSVIRWFFIMAFLLLSNAYLAEGNRSNPLKGGDTSCMETNLVLSHTAICTWEGAYQYGLDTFLTDQRIERMKESVATFTLAAIDSVMLFKFAEALRLSVRLAEAAAGKAFTRTEVRQVVQNETPKNPLKNIWEKIVSPLMYLFLAVPLVIYLGLILYSAFVLIIATILLPIAIALLAFGLDAPVLRIATTIFGQILTIWLLPLFFYIAFSFALDTPTRIIKASVDSAIQTIVNNINQLANLNNTDTPQQEVQEGKQQNLPWWQVLTNVLNKISDYLDQFATAVFNLVLTIVFLLMFLILGLVMFVLLAAVSFNVAFGMLTSLPAITASILGGASAGRIGTGGPAGLPQNNLGRVFTPWR